MSIDADAIKTLGRALGLFDADGAFDSGWLSDPIARLKGILADRDQREALGEFLDAIIPGPAGDRAGYHPLLFTGEPPGPPAFGNLYLVFEPDGAETVIAIAGEFHTVGAPFQLRASLQVPLLKTRAGSLDAALANGAEPLGLQVSLQLPPSTGEVRLERVTAAIDFFFDGALRVRPRVELEGFELGAAPARDLALDAEALESGAVELVLGLLHDAVANAPEPLRSHLLPALGLDPALPLLPLADIVRRPDALRAWLATLIDQGRLGTWFGHLAALFGAGAVAGAGTYAAPFRAPLLSTPFELALTLGQADGRLYPGVQVRVGSAAAVHLAANLVLLGGPLRGGAVELLPELSIALQSPTPLLAPVLAPDGTTVSVAAGGARAGFILASGQPKALLELTDVTLAGHAHPRIDLTHLDEVGALASDAVEALLVTALGNGAGRHLLALAGVVAPAATETGDVWSGTNRPRLDFVQFLSDPLGALGKFHRDALVRDGWPALLRELGTLVGVAPSTSGAGSLGDPWLLTLASAAPIFVGITVFRSGDASLHLGLDLALDEGAFRVALRSELLRVDLPAAGELTAALFHEHHALVRIAPVPRAPFFPGVTIGADRLFLGVRWLLGSAPSAEAALEGVTLVDGGTALPSFDVTFPFVGGPPPLGDAVLRLIVRKAAARWGGEPGLQLLALLGISRDALLLPADFPLLTGNLQSPRALLRPWLRRVLNESSLDGARFAEAYLRGFSGVLAGATARLPSIAGSGTTVDPWRARLATDWLLELLAWLEPPAVNAATASLVAHATDGYAALAAAVMAVRPHHSFLLDACEAGELAKLATGFELLSTFLAAGDGVVPVASQAVPGVTVAATVNASHVDAVAAATAALSAEIGGSVAVLVSAPFTDHSSFQALVGASAVGRFDFRRAGIPFDRVDLRPVTEIAPFYSVDLSGTSLDTMTAQLERVIDHLATLRPGAPLVLVGHSLSGLAAVRVAATRPARVSKVVTVAAPFLGALPPYIDEPTASTALHVALALLPVMAASTTRRALELGGAASVGGLAPGLTSALPLTALAALTPSAAAAVPTVAIVASVGSGLVAELGAALATLAPVAGEPTLHLAVSTALDAEAPAADLQIVSRMRLDLGSVGLASALADVAARRLSIAIDLHRASGFLLGGPGTQSDGAPWPARIRKARFEVEWDGHALSTKVELIDAALGGLPRRLGLADVETRRLLDELFASIADAPEASKLLAALRALGLLVPSAPRLYGDALTALQSDGAAYLAPRLAGALTASLYGHEPGVGWALGPLALRVDGRALRVVISHPIMQASLSLDTSTLAWAGEAVLSVAGAKLTFRPGALDLELSPWLPRTTIWPAGPEPVELVERLLFSTGADALLATVMPSGAAVPLDALLAGRIAFDASRPAVSAGTIAFILTQLGAALGMPARNGLLLAPAGILLSAVETSDHRTELRLATEAPIGGVLGISAGIRFGGERAPEPLAAFSLQVPNPPPPAGAGAWQDVSVELGLAPTGITLALVVGATRVTFLPEFSGWLSLLGGGVALLPHALDEITPRIAASPVKTAVLAVATELSLYGPDFSSHTADFQALTTLAFDSATRGRVLGAVATLMNALGLPGGAARVESVLTWTSPALLAPASGSVSISLDWTAEVPALDVAGGIAIVLATGGGTALERVALRVGLDARLGADFHALGSVGLDAPLGTGVVPRFEVGVRQGPSAAEPVVRLLPLATATGEGPLEVALLPSAAAHVDDAALPGAIGFGILLPLLSALLERVTGTTVLWPGGPTLPHLVDASGLFDGAHRLVTPPPDVPTVLGGIAAAMSFEVTLGELQLTLGSLSGAGHVGVAASGYIPIPIDSVELDIIFGEPSGGAAERTSVTLFRRVGGNFQLAPLVSANHFGVGLRGAQGRPLLSTDHVRLGGAEAFTYFDIAVHDGSADATFRGVGLGIDGLGISLGSATGGGNAIASGLMKSSSSGDSAPAQPEFGIDIEYKRGSALEGGDAGSADFELGMRLKGLNPRRAWIGIRAGFGPLYIDQVGIELEAVQDPDWIRFLVDGGVNVAGFAAQVDDLAVQIPLRDAGDPSKWGIDLAGLGVAYSQGGISLLGGLVKHTLENPAGVEYVGMLQLRFQAVGAVAVGAWSKQIEHEEELDSLFIFAAVFLTISFAPYFELQALGAGFGYNRALVVPEDINQIPQFSLLTVLDDPSKVEHPMELLESLRMPVRKGSFWFAAGIRGALFVVVDVIAVVYVALDKGFEIGVVGVGRLSQPKGSPIVSIELAIKARYSSAEGVLSIQAQLTDNSWLLIHECQLTGGFALFIWFPKGKFVLTVGGYHPAFVPEPEFPNVPRLGFRCNLFDVIQLKGESYFALTNSCVMAGTRLEAAYDIGWLRAWFRAWADFLLSWDPFHYDISIGIELGADFSIDIDLLFGTVHIHFSVSVGASLWLVGPPLHGEVHASLGPISITVPFGDSAPSKPDLLPWAQFRDRYVLAGDAAAIPVSVQPDSGLVPPATGSTPPQGSAADPWRLVPEFSVVTTTAMPASRYAGPLHAEAPVAGSASLDLAPMGEVDVATTHRVTLSRTDAPLAPLDPDRFTTELRLGDFPEAVWRFRERPNAATNNVKGLSGVKLNAIAEAMNPSAPVPIMTLVDVGRALPLPFAAQTPAWRADAISKGNAAKTAKQRLGQGDVVRLLESGSPALAGAADQLGLGAQGISGSGARSLRRRKSPPVIAALSEGLDLAAVARGVAVVPAREQVIPAERKTKLLHAAMRAVEGVGPSVIATRVSQAAGLARRSPPKPTQKLGRLVRLPGALPRTALAAAPQVLLRGPRAKQQIARFEKRALGDGATLAAGAVQLWQLAEGAWTLELSGDAARVVALGRAGFALLDVEVTGQHSIRIPERAETLALWSLGTPREGTKSGSLGAISLNEGQRAPIAVGWHRDAPLHQVSSLAALGRGARLRWSVPLPVRDGFVLGARVVGPQTTVETTLPHGVSAVLVVADAVDPTAARLDDLELRVAGATLGPPILFDGQSGEAALYPVAARADFSLSVGSLEAFRLKGVLGFRGRAEELAPALHGKALGDLLSDGPLGSRGSVAFSLRGERK